MPNTELDKARAALVSIRDLCENILDGANRHYETAICVYEHPEEVVLNVQQVIEILCERFREEARRSKALRQRESNITSAIETMKNEIIAALHNKHL